VAHNRIPSKNTRSSLQCSRCCKLRRSCLGEPGVSCKYCTRNRARCSFLDPRPFRCEPCNRDYATDAALRGHNTRSHPRDLDVPEVPHIPSSPPSSISQIPTSSLQQHEKSKTSIDHILNISCDPTNRPSGEAGSQRRWYFDSKTL
jgi:hypothetical protein